MMCNKAECINWDSDKWGGHCMCLEPPCQNPSEYWDEHGIPRKEEIQKKIEKKSN